MSFSVEIRSSQSRPDLRVFILHGIPPIDHPLELRVDDERQRIEIANNATKQGFALGQFFIKQPSIPYVRARNINGVPCLDIVMGGGKTWTQGLELSAKKAIEKALQQNPCLIGADKLTQGFNRESFVKELSRFIADHPLQKTVKDDSGSMLLKEFDHVTGQATITRGGNCASQSTCKSSGGPEISENIMRNSILLSFPGIVYSVGFDS